MGRITASFNDSFAASSPATSSHRTLGVSDKIAPDDRQFSVSLGPGRERGGGNSTNLIDLLVISLYQHLYHRRLPSYNRNHNCRVRVSERHRLIGVGRACSL
jgi:hypothetical protein